MTSNDDKQRGTRNDDKQRGTRNEERGTRQWRCAGAPVIPQEGAQRLSVGTYSPVLVAGHRVGMVDWPEGTRASRRMTALPPPSPRRAHRFLVPRSSFLVPRSSFLAPR